MSHRKKVQYVQVDENGTEHPRWPTRSFVPQTTEWYTAHGGICVATDTVTQLTMLLVEPAAALYPFGVDPAGEVTASPQSLRVKLQDEHGLHPGFSATLELTMDPHGVWHATGLETVVREAQAAHLPLPWKLHLDT